VLDAEIPACRWHVAVTSTLRLLELPKAATGKTRRFKLRRAAP